MTDSRLTYFSVHYRLEGSSRYFVWYSSEQDGVLLAAPDRIATFSSLASLETFLSDRGLKLEPDPAPTYDFDQIAAWTDRPKAESIDCSSMLDMWNMISDIARSTSFPIPDTEGFTAAYDKLFFGSNLPAVTPVGQHYKPEWSEDEIAVIARVLSSGLSCVRQVAGYAG